MRIRHVCLAAALLGLGLAAEPNAQGGVWVNSLKSDKINTFTDESREVFVDVDGSGSINKGDVVYGFVRMDTRSAPLPTIQYSDSNFPIYAIFSQQFGADPVKSAVDGDGNYTYFVDFVPTTVATLTLSDLLGLDSPGAGIIADGMVAIMEAGPGFDDYLTSPPGTGSADDAIAQLVLDGDLALVTGKKTGTNDNFDATTTLMGGFVGEPADWVASIANAAVLESNIELADFDAGLSVLYNAAGSVTYKAISGSSPGLHQMVIHGTLTGSADGPADPNEFFSFFDHANFSVSPHITPEPASMAIWFGLASCVAVGAWHRSRKSA